MLKIDRNTQSFSALDTPTLADVSIMERHDLQEFICNSPEAFFGEIGQALFLLGKEVEPSKTVQDRIDLLAVDKEGTCVIIELKRGTHKLHLLQAISYAGMISQWASDDLVQLLDEDQQEALSDFLEVDREDINRQQRIILIAEAYDYALLVATEWLSEQYGVDIRCCRIAVAKDSATDSEYLVCSNAYPAPELVDEAVSRGGKRRVSKNLKWHDWETALANITNPAVVAYFRQQRADGREAYLPRRILRYRIGGKQRFSVGARTKNVYVWQHGRFADDLDFWKTRVSQPNKVTPVKGGECLRFYLHTDVDFRSFHNAATQQLTSKEWTDGVSEEEAEEVEAGV